MGKILVSGGAGYIGSHVANVLAKQGRDLITYDNLSTGSEKAVLHGEFIQADLEDLEKLESVFLKNEISAVLHFAGSIVVPESVENPLKYYNNNTKNTLKLIELCVKHKVKKFIFSSTAATYGVSPSGFADEQSPLSPINPYGRSKLITEWMLEDISRAHDLNFVALRYFNVAGASLDGTLGQNTPNATHLIKVASQVAIGKIPSLYVYGTDYDTPDGTCIRDYIHIDDLAQAHADALKFLDEKDESLICNCGYGSGFSVKEVIAALKKVSGVDFKIIETDRRAGDPPSLIANSELIKQKLGWNPQHNDLELIVKSALEWEKKVNS